MPIVITARHRCEKCSKVFEWNHFEKTKDPMGLSLYRVESIPTDKNLAYRCQRNDKGKYNVIVNCPHCHYENRFEYSPDEE